MKKRGSVQLELGLRRQNRRKRRCDSPGCAEEGLYRAPRSRALLDNFYWFCLDHVRDYNRAWDYYAGMSEAEIEEHLRQDIIGHRPTWPFGARIGGSSRWQEPGPDDIFGLFEDDGVRGSRSAAGGNGGSRSKAAKDKALEILDLDPSVSMERIKQRYKELAKRLHPDANGGDRSAEEKLKIVNQAYATLKNAAVLR